MKNDLLEVCKIGKTVGLKGALRLHDLSDFPNQFKKSAKFYDKDGNEFTIKSFSKNNSLVIFEGYEDINLAKNLVNKILYRSKADTIKYCHLEKDEFYYFDIIGCEIYENDILLGVVKDIMDNMANDLFIIETSSDLKSYASEFYIPYHDNFVEKVDIKTKKIYVKNSLEILKNS